MLHLPPISRSRIFEGRNVGIREQQERFERATEMPHRAIAPGWELDTRHENILGRLFFDGLISEAEHDAGLTYGRIALEWLASIDAPEPYGGDLGSLAEDACYQRKILYAEAKTVLREAGKVSVAEVDRVCVYGEPPRNCVALRAGLAALAGEYRSDEQRMHKVLWGR